MGIYLSIWVRASLLPHVHGIQILSVATGMMGYLGNKGTRRVEGDLPSEGGAAGELGEAADEGAWCRLSGAGRAPASFQIRL